MQSNAKVSRRWAAGSGRDRRNRCQAGGQMCLTPSLCLITLLMIIVYYREPELSFLSKTDAPVLTTVYVATHINTMNNFSAHLPDTHAYLERTLNRTTFVTHCSDRYTPFILRSNSSMTMVMAPLRSKPPKNPRFLYNISWQRADHAAVGLGRGRRASDLLHANAAVLLWRRRI